VGTPVSDMTDTTVDGLEPVAGAEPDLDLSVEPDELTEDPFDDDLASQLRSRAPLPITRATLSLAGLVLVVAGFLGGILVQKSFGSTSSSTGNGGALPAALASRAANGGFGGGAGAGGTGGTGAGRGGTTGTVTLVDGNTVYVTTADGQVVIVKTSSSTTVRSEQTLSLKDLKVGSSVTVTGPAGADGSVTATQITQTAAAK
jgi:hypothetical protein